MPTKKEEDDETQRLQSLARLEALRSRNRVVFDLWMSSKFPQVPVRTRTSAVSNLLLVLDLGTGATVPAGHPEAGVEFSAAEVEQVLSLYESLSQGVATLLPPELSDLMFSDVPLPFSPEAA